MRRNQKSKSNRRFYILNERIRAETIRLIDDTGKQLGIFPRQQALNLAKEKGFDLVLIAPQAQPPVVKLIDFKKFLYQENKKQKKAKKGSKKSLTKDIKLSLFVGSNDLERLVKKAKSFINQGHQVRLRLLLRGREITKKSMGFDLINQFIGLLGEVNISVAPKLQGRVIVCIVSKKK